MSKKTLADLHQEENLGIEKESEERTMIIELKGKVFEIALPAFFVSQDEETYAKINENGDTEEINFFFREIIYSKAKYAKEDIIEDLAILDQEKGQEVWDSAVAELKAKINAI